MKQRKFMGMIFMLLAVILTVACSPQTQQSTSGGRAVFTMTDAAANMGAVTSIKVTVDSVKVLSEEGEWIKVSTGQNTYDLLELKTSGTNALLADYNLTAGTYRQVRLDISKVIVTDISGDHIAKLPSGELKLVGKLIINANSTSTIKFDFIADESLHITGDGRYIFAPVIKLETREKAEVDIESEDDVRIREGEIVEDIKVGMDIDGNVGEGLKIRKDSKLLIEFDDILEESDDDDSKDTPCCYFPLSADAGSEAPYENRNDAEAQGYMWQKCSTLETKSSCLSFSGPQYYGYYACQWKDAADWCAGLR